MIKLLTATTFASLITAGPALAGDWDGFYVGGGFGGGFAESEARLTSDYRFRSFSGGTFSSSQTGGVSEDGSAVSMTGLFGLNALFGRFIVGAEVDGSLTSIDINSQVTMIGKDSNGGTSISDYNRLSLQSDWSVSTVSRVGTLIGDNTLIYALGGLTYAHFEVDDFDALESTTFQEVGATVGGGIEQRISQRLSLRGEYRFTDFGDHTASTRARLVFPGDFEESETDKAELDIETHFFRAVVVLSLQ